MVNVTSTPNGDLLTYYDVEGVETELIYNAGTLAWIIVATALVFIMIPGLGFFYAGLLRKKSALSMIWMSMTVMSVVTFEWFFWGFSLAFSTTSSNAFIGNLDNFGLMNVDIGPSTGGTSLPQLLFCIYQMMFAAITPVIACGAFADRARLGPVLIFAFCWSTIVYNPIAYWTWNVGKGWANVMGGLDFAGGTPVHISSGTAALAISIFLGKRKGYGTEQLAYRPHNVAYVILGTVFLWFGWFGFNGGSALGSNLRAVQAMMVTQVATAVGGLTWMFWDWRLERKWSAVGFCSGAISGLVAITPASGYVGTPAAVAFGVLGGTACNFATGLKNLLGYDDALDIFAAHGVGGIVGNLLTGIFADWRVASFDGSAPIPGGWINKNWIQLGYQAADSASGFGWSFVVTLILLFAIDRIPGCHFRATEEDEALGIDLAQIGEEVLFMPLLHDFVRPEEGAEVHHVSQDVKFSPASSEKDIEAAQPRAV
ncbi:Ammonium transporter AmtB-like domain protein [Kalmanozyma brasiliensis GHG001]|uniref:Ammonium transporter n=1 Tax=Kalmanozyma brasiliensis (strain GHG001) TaxID=1365824 RepID=V5EUF7_KALBG|nr:Ammonium transporter AmtB-like domain protein [Kalmanozyma brasiliensis GHG001]EST05744.1 Ammonium transporter AmtB-like domain protein [Kalmanozyma brasiliensis GHG001]